MELFLTLYAMVILHLSPTPIPAAFKQLKSPGNKTYFDRVHGLEETIQNFLKGDEDFSPMLEGLKNFVRTYEKTPSAKASAVALFKSFVSYISSDNEAAFNRIEKASANPVFPAWVGQNFFTTQIDQDPINSRLKLLMKKMTGESETSFPDLESSAAAKVKFPKVYSEWQQLRKLHAKSWKAAMSGFVKDSGQKTVPYQSLMKFFKKNEIEHSMATGFTGNIDAAGKWYSQFDEPLTGVPSSAVFPTVRMNPDYKKGSTEYVCVSVRTNGSDGGYLYTEATKKGNSLTKFAKVEDFSHIVKAVRSKWVKLIMKGDAEDQTTVAAVVLELLYEFSARVGSRPTEHNGVSSLMVSQYSEKPTGFILKYNGKDNVRTLHVFKGEDALSKRIVEIVRILASNPNKTKKDFLFTYNLKSGVPKLVQSGVVTRVFRACGAGHLSVHKLRTYHATQLMKSELEKVYGRFTSFKNTATAFGVLKKIALKVGKDLNHVRRNALGETSITPTTALANYIDISLQMAFFQHYALPLPKYLEKYANDPEKMLSSVYLSAEASEEPSDEELQRKTQESEEILDAQETEDEKKLTEEDLRMKKRLKDDAARIGELITKGGRGSGNSAPEYGNFDNVLI